MRVKSNIKAGSLTSNHNQTVKGIRVKSSVKADGIKHNNNQTARGLKVKSSVKAGNDAGRIIMNHNQTLVSGR